MKFAHAVGLLEGRAHAANRQPIELWLQSRMKRIEPVDPEIDRNVVRRGLKSRLVVGANEVDRGLAMDDDRERPVIADHALFETEYVAVEIHCRLDVAHGHDGDRIHEVVLNDSLTIVLAGETDTPGEMASVRELLGLDRP